jgi:nitroreductase
LQDLTADLTADQVLTTTRSVKRRLDFSRPVPRELVRECVEMALQAPNGGNRQEFRFIAIDDADLRRQIADYYGRSFDRSALRPQPRWEGARGEQAERRRASSQYLRDHFHEVPVLVLHCIEMHLPERPTTLEQAGLWGSVLPAAWSFMLAARARGLGSAWTTLHLAYEQEVAQLLGIPADRVTQTGLLPVAYFKGERFQPALRVPVDEVLSWNGFG